MKYCSNCQYNGYDGGRKEFFCNNKSSENYGIETAFDDHCDEWKIKVKKLGYTLNKLTRRKKDE